MITVNELREVLRSIGFVERNDVFSNSYSSGASIDVNFKEKKIISNERKAGKWFCDS